VLALVLLCHHLDNIFAGLEEVQEVLAHHVYLAHRALDPHSDHSLQFRIAPDPDPDPADLNPYHQPKSYQTFLKFQLVVVYLHIDIPLSIRESQNIWRLYKVLY
jgi:hypothetical protein